MKKIFYVMFLIVFFLLVNEVSAICCGDLGSGQCKCFGVGYCCDVNTGVQCAITSEADCDICRWSEGPCPGPPTTTTTTTILPNCGSTCAGLGYNDATCGTCPADGSCVGTTCRWGSSSRGTGPWSDCGSQNCCCFNSATCGSTNAECQSRCSSAGCAQPTTTTTLSTTTTTLPTTTTTTVPTTTTTTTTTTTIPSACIGGVLNGICEAGETQDNCHDDCYTTVSIYPSTPYPGQEVTVTIYFNDSRYFQGHDVKVDLVIAEKIWGECAINGIEWSKTAWQGDCDGMGKMRKDDCEMQDGEWKGDRHWEGQYQGKHFEINSEDYYGGIEATCTIPSDLLPGRYTLKAVPTIYSSPVTLNAAEVEMTVLDGLARLFNYIKSFLNQFTAQFVGVLYG